MWPWQVTKPAAPCFFPLQSQQLYLLIRSYAVQRVKWGSTFYTGKRNSCDSQFLTHKPCSDEQKYQLPLMTFVNFKIMFSHFHKSKILTKFFQTVYIPPPKTQISICPARGCLPLVTLTSLLSAAVRWYHSHLLPLGFSLFCFPALPHFTQDHGTDPSRVFGLTLPKTRITKLTQHSGVQTQICKDVNAIKRQSVQRFDEFLTQLLQSWPWSWQSNTLITSKHSYQVHLSNQKRQSTPYFINWH